MMQPEVQALIANLTALKTARYNEPETVVTAPTAKGDEQ